MPPKKKNKRTLKNMPEVSKGQKIKNSKVSNIEPPLNTRFARNTDTAGQHSAMAPLSNKTCSFSKLPPEVRTMIYRYVFGIDLIIGDRRVLRRESIANRYNRFSLNNFTINHFSLLRISTQIRKEVQAYALNELSFTITSTNALEGFLGYRVDYPGVERDKINDQVLLLLQTAKKITVYIKKSFGSWDAPMGTVGWLGATLKDPSKIKLVSRVDQDELPADVLHDVVSRWKRFAETL